MTRVDGVRYASSEYISNRAKRVKSKIISEIKEKAKIIPVLLPAVKIVEVMAEQKKEQKDYLK